MKKTAQLIGDPQPSRKAASHRRCAVPLLIIALAAVIGLGLAGCTEPGDDTFTVSFNANGGTPAPQTQSVTSGGTVNQPPAMTKGSDTFGGWYTDPGFNTPAVFPITVTGDINLYAKWIPGGTSFTVSFNADGGTPAPQTPQSITSGGTVNQPPAMTKSGHAFGGWYTDPGFTTPAVFPITVTGNIDLYAKWNPAQATAGLLFTSLGSAYMVAKGTATAAEVVIPALHEGLPVTQIAPNGFSNYTNMTGITIPDSVTNIGQYAFNNCTSLTSIALPNSVTNIGNSVLSGCTSLTSVTIPFLSQALGGTSGHIGYIFGASSYSSQNVNIPASLKTVVITSINIPDNAFNGCTGLTSVILPGETGNGGSGWSLTIPSNVVSIGNNAFYGCSSLESITIPFVGQSATATGNNALFGYIFGANTYSNNGTSVPASLKTVVITGGNSIADNAFRGCTGLTSVTIPTSVTTIGNSAFDGCSSLTSVTIGDSVESIGNRAFGGCTSLTSIDIPDSVISIGGGVNNTDGAFNGCTGLTDISGILAGRTSIENGWFQGCTGLTSIAIPASVESIGYRAFFNCTGLASVAIPDSVTSIGGSAFSGCTGLESITIPFAGNTLDGTTNTNFGYIFGANTYSNNGTSVPASLKTVVITGGNSIANNAFSSCIGLTSVTIPDSVTSIGLRAFYNCTSLASVTVDPNNPNYISQNNIVYNKDMTTLVFAAGGISGSVTIPASVTSIGSSAFSSCIGLTSVTIPDSVTSIGDRAFRDCTGLTSVTIPDSVESIGQSAFMGCTGLASVTVDPDNQNYASQDGILYNKAKTAIVLIPQAISGSITIPSTMTSLPNSAFSGCTGLTSIDIPDRVTTIGDSAFRGCTGLASIDIPDSVTSIGQSAFLRCTGLTSVTIPDSVTSIGSGAFVGCTGLSVTIGAGVTSIGSGVFIDCTGLKSVTIPNSVTTIGDSAFRRTPLTSVTIPDSVTSIVRYAFDGCTGLTSVTFEGADTTFDIGYASFPYAASLRTAYTTGGIGIYTLSGTTWTKQ